MSNVETGGKGIAFFRSFFSHVFVAPFRDSPRRRYAAGVNVTRVHDVTLPAHRPEPWSGFDSAFLLTNSRDAVK